MKCLKKNYSNILITVVAIVVIYLLVFPKQTKPIFKLPTVKNVENNIIGKETTIHTIEKAISNEQAIISAIEDIRSDLFAELEKSREQKDTNSIVQIQDTIITTLSSENEHLRTIITNKDSIIVAQRFIINSKDTIIAILESDRKKFRRQRNISLLINTIQTGIIILK